MNSQQEINLTHRQRFWFEHIQACEVSGKAWTVTQKKTI